MSERRAAGPARGTGATRAAAAVAATVAAAVAAVIAAVALGACWSARAPRHAAAADAPVPGTLWATPAQPWRTTEMPTLIAAAGDTAMFATQSGWLARFDLARGALVGERWLDDIRVEQLLALPRGGWLLVGLQGGQAFAAEIDPRTLELEVVVTGGGRPGPEHARGLQAASRAAVLDEGIGLVIDGLPLAIYDPASWQVRRVVDPATGWRGAAGAGRALYAVGDDGLVRFDLAGGPPGGPAKRFASEHLEDATASYVVTSELAEGRWAYDAEGGGRKTRIAVGDWPAAVDRARDRIAIRDGAAVHVHALADGKRLASYELGPSGRSFTGIAFAGDRLGDRLIVASGSLVRVIDLASGAITPAGDPPYGASKLSVSADGEVLAFGRHVVRVAQGKVAAADAREPETFAVGDPHQVARYAVSLTGPHRVEVREPGARAPAGSWRIEVGWAREVWISGTGQVAIDAGDYEQRMLVRGAGPRLEPLARTAPGSWIQDVDLDGGQALVSVEGTAYLVRLAGPAVLRALPLPGCAPHAAGTLERGGDRVLFRLGPELAIYRRSTGALVGAARIPALERVDVYETAFVPGRDEILIAARDALLLWEPATAGLRRLGGLAGVAAVQASPDARFAGLSFGNGRIVLVALDALRAAMRPGRAARPAAEAPASCPGGEPLASEASRQEP